MRRITSSSVKNSPRGYESTRRSTLLSKDVGARDSSNYLAMKRVRNYEREQKSTIKSYHPDKQRVLTMPTSVSSTLLSHNRKRSMDGGKLAIAFTRQEGFITSFDESRYKLKDKPEFQSRMTHSNYRSTLVASQNKIELTESRPTEVEDLEQSIAKSRSLLAKLKDKVADAASSLDEERRIFDVKYEDVKASIQQSHMEFTKKKAALEEIRADQQIWLDNYFKEKESDGDNLQK